MDRAQLADFLRTRRAALQPTDVGLPAGPRRRTSGLRREEVASLAQMSVDYYTRLEQQRGPQPSTQMLGAIARALRLSRLEGDHLHRIAGHAAPTPTAVSDRADPALLRVVDKMDVPVVVLSRLGEALAQNGAAVGLLGDLRGASGLARFPVYRWYTDPTSREIYLPEDYPLHAGNYVRDLRAAYAVLGADSEAGAIVTALIEISPEFVASWSQHEVGAKVTRAKRIVSPVVGLLELDCQQLFDRDGDQSLMIFTAAPGTESAARLALLADQPEVDTNPRRVAQLVAGR